MNVSRLLARLPGNPFDVIATVIKRGSGYFILGILTTVLPLHAAEYSLEYGASLRASYDDNVRLNPSDDALSGGTLTARSNFSRDDTRNLLTSGLEVDAHSFNQDGYDTTDFSGDLKWLRRYERGTLSLGINGSRDSTRTSEAAEDGSGLIEAEATRVEKLSSSLGWMYRITEKQSLSWNIGANRNRYESLRFSDSDVYRTGLVWRYAFSEKLTPLVKVSYADVASELDSAFTLVQLNPLVEAFGATLQDFLIFCPAGVPGFIGIAPYGNFPCVVNADSENDQQVLDVQLGFDYEITENWTMSLSVGQTQVDTKRTDVFSSEIAPTGFVLPSFVDFSFEIPREQGQRDTTSYEVTTSYDDGRLGYIFLASQENDVDSFGRLTLNTRANFTVNWEATEHRSWRGRLGWLEREASDGTGSVAQDRDTSSILISHYWKMAESWEWGIAYEHQEQGLGFDSVSNGANRVFLTVDWRPTTLKWSR